MDKIIKKLNYILIIFLILLVPLFFLKNLLKVYFSWDVIIINYSEVLWLLILFFGFIYIYNIIKKKIKLGIFDYLIFLLLILNFIVCNFAIDLTTSVWGTLYRNEGLLSFIAYYLIFLNCKSIDDENQINKILNIFILIGLLQFVYCFIQIYFKSFLLPELSYNVSSNMASGFINNSNFLGSYVIMLLGIVVMKFLTQEKKYKRYFVLSIIFFINLIFTQSTGPFLAFIFTFIFSIILLIIKKKFLWKRFLSLFICLILVYFTIDLTLNSIISKENVIKSYTINYDLKQIVKALTGKMEIYDMPEEVVENNKPQIDITDNDKKIDSDLELNKIIEKPVKDEDNLNGLGSGRIMIWRNTLKLVPKYFWFGCGIDNFGFAYKWHYNNIFYDKAHNDYLQILVSQGIFVLITYLVFLVMLFIKGIKSNNTLVWALLLSFFGYCVQSFTNISVINVAPYFYMICGLLAALIHKKNDKDVYEIKKN